MFQKNAFSNNQTIHIYANVVFRSTDDEKIHILCYSWCLNHTCKLKFQSFFMAFSFHMTSV